MACVHRLIVSADGLSYISLGNFQYAGLVALFTFLESSSSSVCTDISTIRNNISYIFSRPDEGIRENLRSAEST